jgi:hypothetical protein
MLNNNRISLGSLGDSDIKLLYMMKLVIAFLVPALLMACNEDSKKIKSLEPIQQIVLRIPAILMTRKHAQQIKFFPPIF